MIAYLTDEVIIKAADYGARRFLNCFPHGSSWIGDMQDVFQEGRLFAFAFLRRSDNPSRLNPAIVSRRVYYDLIDLVRSRSKCRTLNPAPCWVQAEESLLGKPDVEHDALDIRDVLATLFSKLTPNEAITLDLFKRGFSQAQIGRELELSRSCVSKRFRNIRQKLAEVLGEYRD